MIPHACTASPDAQTPISESWPVIVIGGGPAGTAAAIELARRNIPTLLIEKSRFPRFKVCGGCVNGAALAQLHQLGVADECRHAGAVPLHRFHLDCGNRELSLPLSGGFAISRERLDQILLDRARTLGVVVLEGTTARLIPTRCTGTRQVKLQTPDRTLIVEASFVIVAAGLAGQSFGEPSPDQLISKHAPIGLGAQLGPESSDLLSGIITMKCRQEGYVGLTRIEGGRINVAAAVAPAFLARRAPRSVISSLLPPAHILQDDINAVDWRGTVPLTRMRRSPAGTRTLYVGDSAGYVEPFTGEGIAWALASGRAAATLLAETRDNDPEQIAASWHGLYCRDIRRQQKLCRLLSCLLRHPRWLRAGMSMATAFPQLALPLTARLTGIR